MGNPIRLLTPEGRNRVVGKGGEGEGGKRKTQRGEIGGLMIVLCMDS